MMFSIVSQRYFKFQYNIFSLLVLVNSYSLMKVFFQFILYINEMKDIFVSVDIVLLFCVLISVFLSIQILAMFLLYNRRLVVINSNL